MIKLNVTGSFRNVEGFGSRVLRQEQFQGLAQFGPQGVAALKAATPVDEGNTANAWIYEIVRRRGYFAIHWSNTNVNDGIPVAVLLQYGHGTRNGGYVQGTDYINPALKPIFDQIAADMWKVVTN